MDKNELRKTFEFWIGVWQRNANAYKANGNEKMGFYYDGCVYAMQSAIDFLEEQK